jgi:hypothetical protein
MVTAFMIAIVLGATDDRLGGKELVDTLFMDRYALIEALLDEHELDEGLEFWLTAGIDVNAASKQDILSIPGVDPRAARQVVAWRDSLGGFRSMDFLDTVTVIDRSDVDLLRAFLIISMDQRSSPRSPTSVTSVTRLTRRIETARGYQGGPDERAYLGRPERVQQRINLSTRRISSGLTFDKPQGSPFLWQPYNSWYGFNRVHGFITAGITPRLTIVAGDFRAEYGQGLAMWSGSSFGKGRDVVRTVERRRSGLRGSASTLNERVFRGLGLSVDLTHGVRADVFASRRMLDAVIDSVVTSDGEMMRYAGITSPSMHRTTRELARRKTLGEDVIGGALLFQTGAFSVGAAGFSGRYALPIQPSDRPDLIFQSADRTIGHSSIFGSAGRGETRFFGEMVPTSGGVPFTLGARIQRGRDVEAVVGFRNLPPTYHNPFSAGFAHRSSPLRNEQGIYVGAMVRATSTVTVRGYIDVIEHPWVRYLDARPASGIDGLLEWQHRPRRWFDYYVLLRRRSIDDRFTPDGGRVSEMVRLPRTSARIHVRVSTTNRVTLQSRVEAIRSMSPESNSSHGYLLFQEVQVRTPHRMNVSARISQFDVGSFGARIYAYEHDVTGAFSSRMFTGQGTRAYMLGSVHVSPRLELQTRVARTWFDGVDSVSSGYDRIDGRRVTDITFQLIGRR